MLIKLNAMFRTTIADICTLLIFIALLASFFSDVLLLGEYRVPRLILFGFLLLLFMLMARTIKKHQEQFRIYLPYIFGVSLLLLVICQLYLLIYFQATPKFDAGLLLSNLETPHLLSPYLSNNVNNQFFFFFNLWLSRMIGTSIKSFQLFNLFILLVSIFLLIYLMNLLFKKRELAYLAGLILMFIVMFQPLFLVPYTDSYCLPLVLLATIFIFDKL